MRTSRPIWRDTVLAANPMYPIISTQEGFRINFNEAANCNANYDGSEIHFQAGTSSCSNTAFGTFVHHEYGHHLVQVAGNEQRQYGEGMGDVMGVLITDVSGFAVGHDPIDCTAPVRDAANMLQYDPDTCPTACQPGCGIHCWGQLISGCVWSTRNELLATDPFTYRDVLSSLAINSLLLHTGQKITPQIYIDWMVLDDDGGDLTNGTPHGDEITAGFAAHSMTITLPGGANSGATVFTWTDEAPNDHSWEHSCNWQPPVPTCSGDYPQDAVDVAFIDGSSGTGDVDLVSVTIAKFQVGRDVTLRGSGMPGPTLQVKAFVIYGADPDLDVTVTVVSATIKQPPSP